MSPPPAHSYDSADTLALRQALGEYATGVAIITAPGADGMPVGITVNSFASVSLDPPLVLWSISLQARSLPVFEHCAHFAVNVLAADQADLSQRFARPQADKFEGIEWSAGAGDTALLPGCCAWYECATAARHEGGDHIILVGRVLQFRRAQAAPLIFHRGAYASLGAAAQ